jgi:hypothetical protein
MVLLYTTNVEILRHSHRETIRILSLSLPRQFVALRSFASSLLPPARYLNEVCHEHLEGEYWDTMDDFERMETHVLVRVANH